VSPRGWFCPVPYDAVNQPAVGLMVVMSTPPAQTTCHGRTLMYLGLDRSAYPGDSVMATLYRDTNLYFTCFYLAPAPSHGESSWMTRRPTLLQQGWGFLPTYVGRQVVGPGSHVVTAAQGVADAHDAHRLMSVAGFETGTVVYLDIENGAPLLPAQEEYIRAWIRTVNQDTSYWPGVYCHKHAVAARVRIIAGEDLPIWVYGPQHPHPALPAGAPRPRVVVNPATETGPATMPADYPDATAWQYLMSLNCVVDLRWVDGGSTVHTLHEVDLNVATVADPSFSPAPRAKVRDAKVRDAKVRDAEIRDRSETPVASTPHRSYTNQP